MLTFDIIHNQKYDFHWPTCVWLFKTFKSSLFQSFIGLKVLMWSPSTIRLKISSFTRTCWWHDYSPRLTTKLVFATIVIYLKVFWREPNSQSSYRSEFRQIVLKVSEYKKRGLFGRVWRNQFITPLFTFWES